MRDGGKGSAAVGASDGGERDETGGSKGTRSERDPAPMVTAGGSAGRSPGAGAVAPEAHGPTFAVGGLFRYPVVGATDGPRQYTAGRDEPLPDPPSLSAPPLTRPPHPQVTQLCLRAGLWHPWAEVQLGTPWGTLWWAPLASRFKLPPVKASVPLRPSLPCHTPSNPTLPPSGLATPPASPLDQQLRSRFHRPRPTSRRRLWCRPPPFPYLPTAHVLHCASRHARTATS